MRLTTEGMIGDRISIAGHPIYPGYLIQGGKKNLMIEAGLNMMGPVYQKAIRSLWGDENRLDYLFVTHGHYDHIGALPYLKRNIPGLELRAHKATGPLLDKEKVLQVMNFLSRQTCEYFEELRGGVPEDVEIRPVVFGEPLKDGDTVDLGELHCEVFETPGHTQDHLSFFLAEEGILFPGEALGNPIMQTENEVKVEFLTSYSNYLASIEKLLRLVPRVKIIAMSHLYYYTGDHVPRFMELALRDTVRYKALIDSYLDMEHGDVEKAAATMLRIEYDEKGAVYQERNAYATNLAAQVKAVAALRS